MRSLGCRAQYAVLIYAHDSAHAPDATPEDTASSDRHSDELTQSGSMVMACALTPRDMATSIRGDTLTDGPFVDSKEVIAGFYVIEAPDLDAALAIARLNPVVREGGGVEVRPVHSSTFGNREERRAIDAIRREKAFRSRLPLLVEPEDAAAGLTRQESMTQDGEDPDHVIPDERLRLIFTCCHPALAQEAQVAPTLRLCTWPGHCVS